MISSLSQVQVDFTVRSYAFTIHVTFTCGNAGDIQWRILYKKTCVQVSYTRNFNSFISCTTHFQNRNSRNFFPRWHHNNNSCAFCGREKPRLNWEDKDTLTRNYSERVDATVDIGARFYNVTWYRDNYWPVNAVQLVIVTRVHTTIDSRPTVNN